MTDPRRKKIDRRTVLGGIGTGIAAGLAGCSGDGDNGSGGNGSGSDGGGQMSEPLEFWLFGGIPAEREYISGHYDNYEDHSANYTHQEWGQKYQIIASAAANNNLPHVMAGQTQQIPDYAGAEAIRPLDQEPFMDRLEEINDLFIDANVQTQMYEGIGGYEEEREGRVPGGHAGLGGLGRHPPGYF